MEKQIIERAVKYNLPNGVVLVGYTGNLTQNKKTQVAGALAEFLNTDTGKTFLTPEQADIDFSAANLANTVDDGRNSGVYQFVEVTPHDNNLVTLSGPGWAMVNRNQDFTKIIHVED